MNDQRKDLIIKQKFKLESFFVDKKDEKRKNLANKTGDYLKQIASNIERSKIDDIRKKI